MTLVAQAQYALLHAVSRKTVTKWKDKGYLVIEGGLVNVEATDAILKDRSLGRFKADPGNELGNDEVASGGNGPAESLDAQVATANDFISRVLSGAFATVREAERIKENALALKHVLESRQKAGVLIEVAVAERILFEVCRSARDSWINWPSRVGPLIAAEMGIDADKVTEVLAAYVQQHLDELGEPGAEFRSEG